MTTTSLILLLIVQSASIVALSPLFIGITRKVKAKLQNRDGASIFQPYRTLWKLFHKDEVISEDASWVFRFAPYLVFATTLAIGASIPFFSASINNVLTGDFIAVVYLFALGTFFLALSGIDAGSAFGGFGSSREMLLASLAEAGLMLSLLTTALMSGTTNLTAIALHMTSLPIWDLSPALLAFAAFTIALLAENARYPFDNPATHLELTMVHEAMILEYSGKRLALMEWAAANKYLLFMLLGAELFFPWGITASLVPGAIVMAVLVALSKVLVFSVAIGMLESTIAKLRIFRLPSLLFASFVLGILAIGLIA